MSLSSIAFVSVLAMIIGNVQAVSSLPKRPAGPTGRELIFELESRMTCLYEPLKPGMNLILDLDTYPPGEKGIPVQMRLSSPSSDFSDWANGDGNAHLTHNVTEEGDYEICFYITKQKKVMFSMFFLNPVEFSKELEQLNQYKEYQKTIETTISNLFQHLYKVKYSVKFYNQIVVRDESIQESNSENIKMFSIVFSIANIIVALTSVCFIRKMFNVDTSRIRI